MKDASVEKRIFSCPHFTPRRDSNEKEAGKIPPPGNASRSFSVEAIASGDYFFRPARTAIRGTAKSTARPGEAAALHPPPPPPPDGFAGSSPRSTVMVRFPSGNEKT